MNLLRSMDTRSRLTLGACLLGVIVVAFFLMRVATSPSYTTMLSGVDPAQTQQITDALDERGIAYKLENNGTALAVEKGSTAEARVALAAAGLDESKGQPGFEELMDKQKLGTSDFQQKVNYQRALEGEIAKTVGQINGVNGAQVQLTLPEDELFADEAKPATAAVLLGGAETPDPTTVKGIANLVASSVEGLKPGKVTITDGTGQLVWPNEQGVGAGATTKVAAEGRYAAQLESQLSSMLSRTLGPNRAQVEAKADLNVDESTEEKLDYGRRGVPLRSSTERERLQGGQGGGGTAGAIPNIAGPRNGGGGADSNYRRTRSERDLAIDKTVTRTKVAPGKVNRLDVALLLDRTVPAADVPKLEEAVASAAGIDPGRGDTISVNQIAFTKPPQEMVEGTPIPAGLLAPAKYVGLGLAALAFLFFVTRALRRREAEPIGPEPTWLREIEEPRTLAALETRVQQAVPSFEAPPPSPARVAVEAMVRDEPEKVAQQLRAWLDEDQR